MKDGQYHFSTPNLSKDESLWSSQWCLIRTLSFIFDLRQSTFSLHRSVTASIACFNVVYHYSTASCLYYRYIINFALPFWVIWRRLPLIPWPHHSIWLPRPKERNSCARFPSDSPLAPYQNHNLTNQRIINSWCIFLVQMWQFIFYHGVQCLSPRLFTSC